MPELNEKFFVSNSLPVFDPPNIPLKQHRRPMPAGGRYCMGSLVLHPPETKVPDGYVEEVMTCVRKRNPAEPEFYQAVQDSKVRAATRCDSCSNDRSGCWW